MDAFLSLIIGIGLSAACGFRVFVPLLVLSIASLSGQVHLAPGFAWIGTYPALGAFIVATILEIIAYYVPVVDNVLDTIATPTAAIAGTIITASFIIDMGPLLKWSLAAIAGGGTASLVQWTTVATRAISTTTTGGMGNPLFATLELGGSLLQSIVSIILPLLGLLLVAALLCLGIWWIVRRKRAKASPAAS